MFVAWAAYLHIYRYFQAIFILTSSFPNLKSYQLESDIYHFMNSHTGNSECGLEVKLIVPVGPVS